MEGTEGETYVGLNARFGPLLPSNSEEAIRLSAVFSDPADCCSNSSSQVLNWSSLLKHESASYLLDLKNAEVSIEYQLNFLLLWENLENFQDFGKALNTWSYWYREWLINQGCILRI